MLTHDTTQHKRTRRTSLLGRAKLCLSRGEEFPCLRFKRNQEKQLKRYVCQMEGADNLPWDMAGQSGWFTHSQLTLSPISYIYVSSSFCSNDSTRAKSWEQGPRTGDSFSPPKLWAFSVRHSKTSAKPVRPFRFRGAGQTTMQVGLLSCCWCSAHAHHALLHLPRLGLSFPRTRPSHRLSGGSNVWFVRLRRVNHWKLTYLGIRWREAIEKASAFTS